MLLNGCTIWTLTKRIVIKDRWKLLKNVTSCFEQILEAAPQEITAVQPLTFISKTIQVRRTGAWERLRKKQETYFYGPLNMDVPVLADQQELCANTGCRLEDLTKLMDDHNGERDRQTDRESEKSMLSA